MPTWNQVSPQFSRGITTAMGNAQQGISDVGKVAGDYLLRQDRLANEAQRITERQQDVDFRQKQADQSQGNFLKSFGLQEQQALRQQQDQERKLLGEQRLGEFAGRLSGGLSRGEITDPQAAKINTSVEQLAAQGKTPEQITKILQPQLQMQAPKTTADKLAYIRGAGFESPDYDASKLLDYRNKMADPLEQQLRDETKMANDLKLAQLREAGDNARLKKTLAAAAPKAEKMDTTYTYYTDPKTGKILTQPSAGATPYTVKVKSMTDYADLVNRVGKDPSKLFMGEAGKGAAPTTSVWGDKGAETAIGSLDLVGEGQTRKAMSQADAILAANPNLTPVQAASLVRGVIDTNTISDTASVNDINKILKSRKLLPIQ